MKIILTNTFSNAVISTHRTVDAAVKAQSKHFRAIRRRSSNSYTTYSITAADGSDIREEVEAAKINQL